MNRYNNPAADDRYHSTQNDSRFGGKVGHYTQRSHKPAHQGGKQHNKKFKKSYTKPPEPSEDTKFYKMLITSGKSASFTTMHSETFKGVLKKVSKYHLFIEIENNIKGSREHMYYKQGILSIDPLDNMHKISVPVEKAETDDKASGT